jgi:4-hydroxy-tetrahydrodipicolinate synthase
VLSGDDALALPLIALGATGVVSVASNVAPRPVVDLVAAALAGDLASAREQHHRLFPVFSALFVETNPIPIKGVMAELGLIPRGMRLPLEPATAATLQTLGRAMGVLEQAPAR